MIILFQLVIFENKSVNKLGIVSYLLRIFNLKIMAECLECVNLSWLFWLQVIGFSAFTATLVACAEKLKSKGRQALMSLIKEHINAMVYH